MGLPEYRRAFRPGGCFFFTLVTEHRTPIFRELACQELLRKAIADCRARRPFDLDAIVLLLDHLHLMLTLPDGDSDFSTRIASIKAGFTRTYLADGGIEQARGGSRIAHRNRGVWQRRFWEHMICDQDDFNRHLDYIHFNPVKHGLSSCPHAYAASSFQKWVKAGVYETNWLCSCARTAEAPDFRWAEGFGME